MNKLDFEEVGNLVDAARGMTLLTNEEPFPTEEDLLSEDLIGTPPSNSLPTGWLAKSSSPVDHELGKRSRLVSVCEDDVFGTNPPCRGFLEMFQRGTGSIPRVSPRKEDERKRASSCSHQGRRKHSKANYSLNFFQGQYASVHCVGNKHFRMFLQEIGKLLNCPSVARNHGALGFLESLWGSIGPLCANQSMTASLALEMLRQRQRKQELKQAVDPKCIILDCQFALGDKNGRCTLATNILRTICARDMFRHKGPLKRESCVRALVEARQVLEAVFPEENSSCRGQMFYWATGSRSHGKQFVDERQGWFSFDDAGECNFAKVLPSKETEVMWHISSKMQPSTELPLSKQIEYYRIALKAKPTSRNKARFKELLDYAEKSLVLDLTPTGVNGLKDTLDKRWREYFECHST